MSAFTNRPGAVSGDAGVVHYGNPLGEQRQLAEGQAIVDRTDRRVIAVAGVDRLTWLDSIASQALASLEPGRGTELLILDPQGRVEHAASVVDDGETTWLIVDAGDADGLGGWLRRMVFRSRVEVRDETDAAVIAFAGDAGARAAVLAVAPGAPIWTDPWSAVSPGGWQYAPIDPHPGADFAWCEAIVPAEARDELAAGDTAAAGLLAAEALRIAAWRPRWANEVDERSLPHEVDWLRSAVHLEKGCYRGQETVAKVHNLGHPPRRLVMLHLDGSDSVLPQPGAPVANGDDIVGTVTSSALHYQAGPIALAIITRRVPDDVELTVRAGDAIIAAGQEVIVPADAGATASIPRLPRLNRRAPAR
ncbi:MAG TPA: glycine cleavage T C-terminal barrel domain-containing protein [Microbacterium sp.]|uniref:CAF17-like 4Fe-4S cluster assembly/insertion protein YgfZ n=1 Tax=Microbacterium sp. TaxID=51671 RepID=UPI002C0F5B43|nr:glycine cleavage T C-terminal barrel domain-containing protein [Microbacterium sp.]HWI31532.1 glycine cleavage T C-terminal barrel domain-containing protein [Microbacterium sp.]